MNEWVSVEDRLPERNLDNALILISFKGKYLYYVAYFEDGKWYVPNMYGRDCLKDVTHWMPLPEPPKEEPHA